MSSAELIERLALEAVEPIGDRRADYRAAMICWTIACCMHGGQGQRPQMRDFLKMLEFDQPRMDEDLPPSLVHLSS